MTDMSLCYVATILAAVALVTVGLMDILKLKQPSESSSGEVISRQIRGFGILLLSQIVLAIGVALCVGVSGGVEKALSQVGKLF